MVDHEEITIRIVVNRGAADELESAIKALLDVIKLCPTIKYEMIKDD